jgi:hypothetical protein
MKNLEIGFCTRFFFFFTVSKRQVQTQNAATGSLYISAPRSGCNASWSWEQVCGVKFKVGFSSSPIETVLQNKLKLTIHTYQTHLTVMERSLPHH